MILKSKDVPMNNHFDIIIVGGGPAGLTAAIYARRAGKSVLLLEKEGFGGQIAASPLVENFPGLSSLSGAELAERLYSQAETLGAHMELEEVLEIGSGNPKAITTDYGVYTCTALILATGMRHRTLGLPGEDTLRGISFCAVCDGAFYAGQDVAVVGGGNTALQDALFLSSLCRHVTVIHRREAFRGDPILAEQLRARDNVSFALSSEVAELHGTDGALTHLVLRNAVTGAQSQLAVNGLFEAVGQLPEQRLAASLMPVDASGFIPSGEDCTTPAAGIFAAGDCRAKTVRQLTTACADGAVAALAACQYCP
jgi:thioredoxin reductase (NADPH)